MLSLSLSSSFGGPFRVKGKPQLLLRVALYVGCRLAPDHAFGVCAPVCDRVKTAICSLVCSNHVLGAPERRCE